MDRVEFFQLELTVNTAPDQEVRGLTMILTILIHDLIFKFVKIFFFSRYKPAGLAFTIPQLMQPGLDALIVTLRNLSKVTLLENRLYHEFIVFDS